MATRRIARGRGGSPVPIIVLSVLLVGAVGLSIVLGMKTGDLQDQIVEVQKAKQEQVTLRTESEERFRTYETLVGLRPDAMKETFDKLKKEATDKANIPEDAAEGPREMKTVRDLVTAYAEEVAQLRSVRKDLQGKLDQAKEERERAKVDRDKTVDEKDQLEARLKKNAADLRVEKEAVQQELDTTRKKLSGQVAALETEKVTLTKEAAKLKKEVEIGKRTIEDLKKQMEELKHPRETQGSLVGSTAAGEPVDGKIITIEADGKHVMIDLGRRDWVQMGMVFQVYDNAAPDSREVKGEIQVRKVFDTICQCKVMEQDDLDPLLPGMVLVNPAFSRGKTLDFVLVGEFREHNIELLLSRYPCRVAKDPKKLSRDTDYVVTGQAPAKQGQQRPEDSPLVEQARDWEITVMKETALLRYLGELD